MSCKKQKNIKILIVDDDPMFLDGIREYFRKRCLTKNFEITNNSLEAKNLAIKDDFDIIITDIKMYPLNGIELSDQIKMYKPEQKLIVLTQFTDKEHIFPLFKLGVNAIIDKISAKQDILKALKKVLDGQKFYSKKIQEQIEQYLKSKRKIRTNSDDLPKLTRREEFLLPYIARGLSNKEIAKILQNLPEKIFLSEYTIETHRRNLYLKFNVKNASQLTYKAQLYGLLNKN